MLALKLGMSLTSSNKPSTAAGFLNEYSVDLDGVDDFLDCGSDTSLNIGTENSWSFWIKTTSKSSIGFPPNFKYIFGKSGLTIGSNNYQSFIDSSGFVVLDLFTGTGVGSLRGTGSIDIATNNWTHVVIVWDGSFSGAGAIKIYINGSLDSGVSVTGSIASVNTTTSNFNIGTRPGGFGVGHIAGNIDEFAFFNSELSSSNVTAIYNSGKPDDLSGFSPVSWWRMGDPTGTSMFNKILDDGSATNLGVMTNMVSGDIVTVVP